MRYDIVPFTTDHLEPAAVLLAARHRADRNREPGLPGRFGDPAAALGVLREAWASPGVAGAIAYQGGDPVGYLFGMPDLAAPTEAFAGDIRPRSAIVLDLGHAVAGDMADAVYPLLYAVLAGRWLAQGLLTHYITVPAGSAAADVFSSLGFGQMETLAVRDTGSLSETPAAGLKVRAATDADQQIVVDLVAEMLRAFAAPPACWPFLPESLPALSDFVRPLVGAAESPIWLAHEDDRVLGMQLFVTPDSPAWFYPPLAIPERSLLLFAASTVAAARGTGVGTTLLAWSLDRARDAGFEHCLLYMLTASPAAAFWRRHGFRPVRHRLSRTIDERIVWTDWRR